MGGDDPESKYTALPPSKKSSGGNDDDDPVLPGGNDDDDDPVPVLPGETSGCSVVSDGTLPVPTQVTESNVRLVLLEISSSNDCGGVFVIIVGCTSVDSSVIISYPYCINF